MPAASAIIAEARGWRGDVLLRWDGIDTAGKTRVKVVVFFVVVALAYHYSLTSLLQTVGFDTPLAYVGLVPILAAGLAWLRARPASGDPEIHDRQLDYVIAIPLIAVAMATTYLGPARMGDMYWVNRIDLLSLPIFVAGVTALLFGTRALWRQKLAIGYLFLAWPWPYSSILLGTLGGFTDVTLSGLKAVLKVLPVAQGVPGPDNAGLFQVVHHGQAFPVSVVTACSGIDGMVGFFLVGTGFAAIVTGPLLRKATWLVLGLVLLWSTNILRLIAIFWAGQKFGEHIAIGILHPAAGLVLFCLDIVVMLLLLRPFGLRLAQLQASAAPDPSSVRHAVHIPGGGLRQAVPRIFLASAIAGLAGILLAVNNSSLRQYDPVANAAGAPKLTSFLADPAAPAGWQAVYNTQYSINKPLFGQSSLWFRYDFTESYTHRPGQLTSSLPVTADIIDAGGISGFDQYGVAACYSFHGYKLRDVARVSLGNGVIGQALSYSGSNAENDWSIVYWILPVRVGPITRYERTVLYLQNTDTGRVTMPPGTAKVRGLRNALDVASPVDRRLIVNRAFLVAFASQMIADQTHLTDSRITLVSVAAEHVATSPAANSLTAPTPGGSKVVTAKEILALESQGKLPVGFEGVYGNEKTKS